MGFNLDLGTVSEGGSGLDPIHRGAPLGSDRRRLWLDLGPQLESIDAAVEVHESNNSVSFALENLAIVLSLFEDGTDLEGPFSSGHDAQARWLAVGEVVGIVQQKTSWSLFNPQTDRIETVEEMLAGSGVFPQSADPQRTTDTAVAQSSRKRLFRRKR